MRTLRITVTCNLSIAALCSFTSGCRDDRRDSVLSQPVERASLRAAKVPSLPAEAVEAIAAARCKRERDCAHIGRGAAYSEEDDCRRQVRAEWASELNTLACPRGVHEGALARCLGALGEALCDGRDGPARRPDICRASEICPEPSAAPGLPSL